MIQGNPASLSAEKSGRPKNKPQGEKTDVAVQTRKKTRILRIIDRLNIGGPAIHTILLTNGLDKSRFDTILVTGTVEQDEGEMWYLTEEKGIQPVRIPELRRSLNVHHDAVAFWKILRLAMREKPDIIHTHKSKAGTLGRMAGLLLKWRYSSKLVHTFHGHVLHGYFSRAKSQLFIRIERFLARFTDRIIAVSASVKQELIDLKIAPEKKIKIIPLGLELEKLIHTECRAPRQNNFRSVGIVGRLVPIKNHKMFLDSIRLLRDEWKSRPDIKFFITGDGPLRRELEEYTERLGISQDVSFTGWRKDVGAIYSQLDIVTLTSLNEGTPVALIEAMAAGKPVISTDVGGVRDLFSDSFRLCAHRDKVILKVHDQGILIPSGDAEGMAAALKNLLQNEDLRKKMGEAGRKTVYPKYDILRLLEDMKALYLTLIGEIE